jgi:AmiR/NasT family two-component response regulator
MIETNRARGLIAAADPSQGRARRREVLDVRAALERATQHLAAHCQCTPREAREWIQQEARAKKVCLDRVASAILLGETVPYSYDVPI